MLYSVLANLYAELERTPKRLQKTALIAAFLKTVPSTELEQCVLLLQARAFPSWEKQTLGIAQKVMVRTLANTLGLPERGVEHAWKERGDLGLVAEQYAQKRSQAVLFREALTSQKVFLTLRKLAQTEGTGSLDTKGKLLSELFSQANPVELRYLVRTVLEDLRVGVAESTIRDAIVWASFPSRCPPSAEEEPPDRQAYNTILEAAQAAYDRTNDFVLVARAALEGEQALRAIRIRPGAPVKVMLATREPTIAAAFARTGKPAQLEFKYDGFRVQIHKVGSTVTIFTRRLENVTASFPDIANLIATHITQDCILDGEAIGVDPATGAYVPFQQISQRIKRKYNIAELAKKLPVETVLFDILYCGGEELLNEPHSARFARLQRLFSEQPRVLRLPVRLVTADEHEAQAFFSKAKAASCEGLMCKRIDSVYRPGARGADWIKFKDVMEALDLVIIGAEWGEGKRSGWLTSFELACRAETGELLSIGRVGTGLKELASEGLSFGELTELLTPHIEYEAGKTVAIRPAVVVEVAYEEIQRSPSYTSGYALRFPRILRNRTDERGPDDATALSYVEQLFAQQ